MFNQKFLLFPIHTITVFLFPSIVKSFRLKQWPSKSIDTQDATSIALDVDPFKLYFENWFEYPSFLDSIVFTLIILLGLELTNYIAKIIGRSVSSKSVPVRGKHLDEFGISDKIFCTISKANTPLFMYFFLKYTYLQPNIVWDPSKITIWNTLIPNLSLFLVFDFTYTILHWFLHLQRVYPYIHKHHHKQKAPSRANIDAINVNPIEFILGEYNHLFAVYFCSRFMFDELHLVAAILFVAIGGVLAGLNHTRFDVVITIPLLNNHHMKIFDSKDHDVHHRIPNCNYGQYTMFWDHIFGSYRPYNPDDKVNANAQLDPITYKTVKNVKNR